MQTEKVRNRCIEAEKLIASGMTKFDSFKKVGGLNWKQYDQYLANKGGTQADVPPKKSKTKINKPKTKIPIAIFDVTQPTFSASDVKIIARYLGATCL